MSSSKRLAYESGRWNPADAVGLRLDDWGNLQGAVLVERLRTVCGRPLDVDGHLARLRAGAETLGIVWPGTLDRSLVDECVEKNRGAHPFEDFSVVILLTPGRTSDHPIGSKPTLILHTVDLHWRALATWYCHGQSLVTAGNRNVPSNCWPAGIKSRSRLHYFLADREATMSPYSFAGAAMLDQDGNLTESSVANLLIVEHSTLISPPLDSVLQGLSLSRTLRLARQLGIESRYEAISPERAAKADEVLLTGSSGCIWPASRINDVEFTQAAERPICVLLTQAWRIELGLDFVDQAKRCSQGTQE